MSPIAKPGSFADVRVLIFDLDGTLIDSKLDLALSVNATLEHMGRAALSHETIYSYVGRGAEALVRSALGHGITNEEARKGHAYFLSYYRQHMLDNTVTYPGVREALVQLDGLEMAVLTNKPVRFSEAILGGLGIAHHFEFVYGGNSFEKKKPDPVGVSTLLKDLQALPHESMMVGDSDVDVLTARNSGIHSCGVTYGLGLAGMQIHRPDIMVDSLTELSGYLTSGSM